MVKVQEQVISGLDGSDISLKINTVDNAKAQVIYAHGAGANMSHEFMEETTLLLNKANINVVRFNFPFMDKRALTGKKYPPDRMPKLLVCYETVIKHVLDQPGNDAIPLFIGGKSMGSRAAATLLTQTQFNKSMPQSKVLGIFCVGYPFHPAKKPEKLRLEPLFEASKPVLIIQGERDTLGDKAEILSYQLPEHCQCVFLPDGDHSLKPRVKSGFTQQSHMITAIKEISLFIDDQIKINCQ